MASPKTSDRTASWFWPLALTRAGRLPQTKAESIEAKAVRIVLWPLILFELVNFSGVWQVSTQPIWLGLLATSGGSLLWYEGWRWYRRRQNLPPLSFSIVTLGTSVVYLDAAGNMFDWYNKLFQFDKIVHFASGVAVATIVLAVVVRVAAVQRWHLPFGWMAYFAVLSALLMGLGFEVIEFFADLYYEIRFWLGSGVDTLTDLLMNVTGAVTAVLMIRLFKKKRSGVLG